MRDALPGNDDLKLLGGAHPDHPLSYPRSSSAATVSEPTSDELSQGPPHVCSLMAEDDFTIPGISSVWRQKQAVDAKHAICHASHKQSGHTDSPGGPVYDQRPESSKRSCRRANRIHGDSSTEMGEDSQCLDRADRRSIVQRNDSNIRSSVCHLGIAPSYAIPAVKCPKHPNSEG
jgi:hypothetical protein